MSHSPGAWIMTEKGIRTSAGYICFFAEGPQHYTGQDKRYDQEMQQKADNARLLWAAPDLLEALKGLWPHCHEQDMTGESNYEKAWLKAEAAIAKAEGRKA